jgi:hypothetical protein
LIFSRFLQPEQVRITDRIVAIARSRRLRQTSAGHPMLVARMLNVITVKRGTSGNRTHH